MNSLQSNKFFVRLALLWAGVFLGLVVLAVAQFPNAKINSSVLAMLPQQALDGVPPAFNDGFMQRLDQQVVWMVSSGVKPNPEVASYWYQTLKSLPDLEKISGPINSDQQKLWGEFLWQHRNALVDAKTRERLQNGGNAQAQWVLSQLYSAFAGVSGQEIQNDPFLLARSEQIALSSNNKALALKEGWLVTQDEQGNYWYLLHAELAGNSFDINQSHAFIQTLQSLEAELLVQYPQAQLLSRGTVFYSHHASQLAKKDISTLGTATIIGVLILMFLVYRSLYPLLLAVLSIGVGALSGATLTLLVFGELHLITIVMSMSIIGVSADYTLYFMTERMVHGQEVNPWQSLAKVRSSLLMALGTTVVAYLIMGLAPFPAIRQMAVFAIAGLSASCLTVLLWHPWLSKKIPVRPVPAKNIMTWWLGAWQHNPWLYLGLPGAIFLCSLFGLANMKVNDDVSQLQALPEIIHAQDKAITQLTKQSVDQKWIVVHAATAEKTLVRLESLAPALEKAKQQGKLSGYRLLPLNSLQRQQQDLELLVAASNVVTQALTNVGVDPVKLDLEAQTLSVEQWLSSPLSEGWRLLWLTLDSGESAVLVPLEGVNDSIYMAQLAQQHNGVAWLDRKRAFTELFSFYRELLNGLIFIALLVIFISAIVRLGFRKGFISFLPSVLSIGFSLSVLAFVGHSLNLFSLLGLVLVLGIGINYTLFFSNPRGTALTSMLAVILAMLTTLLTLGMLVFSSTQAISSFGIVLISGVFAAFLLSPLARFNNNGQGINE